MAWSSSAAAADGILKPHPQEGSALARAVLDVLAGQARLTLATSHHAELKAAADEDSRCGAAAGNTADGNLEKTAAGEAPAPTINNTEPTQVVATALLLAQCVQSLIPAPCACCAPTPVCMLLLLPAPPGMSTSASSLTPSRCSPPTGCCGAQQAAATRSTSQQHWASTRLCWLMQGYWRALSSAGRRSSRDAWNRYVHVHVHVPVHVHAHHRLVDQQIQVHFYHESTACFVHRSQHTHRGPELPVPLPGGVVCRLGAASMQPAGLIVLTSPKCCPLCASLALLRWCTAGVLCRWPRVLRTSLLQLVPALSGSMLSGSSGSGTLTNCRTPSGRCWRSGGAGGGGQGLGCCVETHQVWVWSFGLWRDGVTCRLALQRRLSCTCYIVWPD